MRHDTNPNGEITGSPSPSFGDNSGQKDFSGKTLLFQIKQYTKEQEMRCTKIINLSQSIRPSSFQSEGLEV